MAKEPEKPTTTIIQSLFVLSKGQSYRCLVEDQTNKISVKKIIKPAVFKSCLCGTLLACLLRDPFMFCVETYELHRMMEIYSRSVAPNLESPDALGLQLPEILASRANGKGFWEWPSKNISGAQFENHCSRSHLATVWAAVEP